MRFYTPTDVEEFPVEFRGTPGKWKEESENYCVVFDFVGDDFDTIQFVIPKYADPAGICKAHVLLNGENVFVMTVDPGDLEFTFKLMISWFDMKVYDECRNKVA